MRYCILSLGFGAFPYVALFLVTSWCSDESCDFFWFGQQRPEISEAVVGTSHSLLWYSLITPAASDSELSNFWCWNPTWKPTFFHIFWDVSMICLKIDGRGHPTAFSYFPPTIFDMRQWPACWFIPDFQHGMQPHWNLAPRRYGYSTGT